MAQGTGGLGERVFGALLRAYPRRFRSAFEGELLSFFRQERARARGRGVLARAGFWLHTLIDVLISSLRQRLRGADPVAPLSGRRRRLPRGGLAADLRFAVRSLRATPALALTAIGALALGIGATTAVWSVVDGVLVRALPYPEAERLVLVGARFRHDPDGIGSVGSAEFADLRARAATMESLAASGSRSFTLLNAGEPRVVSAAAVTGEFFALLGARAMLGRTLGPVDTEPAAPPAAVLSSALWNEVWSGDPAIVGRPIELGGQPYLVVGVLRSDFRPPEALWSQRNVELWVPLAVGPADQKFRSSFENNVVGRLADGAALATARDEADALFADIGTRYYNGIVLGARVEPLQALTVGEIGDTLAVVLAASVVLLLIACANVANLLLVRGTCRWRELALKSALGAGRGRIVRQLLFEALLLALAGGAAGVLLAHGGVATLRASDAGEIPRLAEVAVDLRVWAFALLASLLSGLAAGVAPAVRAWRTDAAAGLREGAPAVGDGRRVHRVRALLLVAQTALAFVLLVGAALLVNSFVRLLTVDSGFESSGVAAVGLRVPYAHREADRILELYEQLHQRVAALPGAESAALTTSLPYTGSAGMWALLPEGRETDEESVFVTVIAVTPEYLDLMGISLVRGRGLAPGDRQGAPPVAIVNEAFARQYWPASDDVLGKLIRYNGSADADPPMTVVGVVADVRYKPAREALPEVYVPFHQRPLAAANVVARTTSDPAALALGMRQVVRDLAPELPIRSLTTMDEIVAAANARPRFYMLLLATLAGVAVLLALVGVYSTLSYSVSQRTREMGIRIALGATRSNVVGAVLRNGVGLAFIGVSVGALGAWGSTRVLASFLFGITTTDRVTYGIAILLFLAVATLAAWLPARRAARLDPSSALRLER